MADQVEVTPDAEYTVSTDDAGASGHVQRVKLALSADGSAAHATVDADGVLVNLGANNDVTVSGVATAANQATIIGHVDGLEALLTSVKTAVEIIDNIVAGSEAQVDVLTMPTVTVQATDLDIRNLSSATDSVTAVLDAGAVNIGDVDVVSVPADPFGANADAAATAGSTGSIQAKLRLVTSQLDAIKTAVETLDNTVGGSELQVDVVGALPAGNNNIGDVDIASIAAGDNNIGNVDVVSLPALAAGTANIGDVDVLTLPALPAGNNNIGDVDVASLPASTNTLEVVGDVAQDIAVAGNPVLVGLRASDAEPTAMSADGDSVYAWGDRSGRTVVGQKAATATLSSVADSASSVTVLAANAARLGATIVNDSTEILYLKMGATASTTSYTVKMAVDAYYEVPFGYTGILDGIWANNASGSARVTELT
jgi:hypothetical protein